ncbi:hypothetical protein GW17_00042289 [Ensete ventricosum]|nr:hypothetical protein GW17_00042289 [Ensete ventricosum]
MALSLSSPPFKTPALLHHGSPRTYPSPLLGSRRPSVSFSSSSDRPPRLRFHRLHSQRLVASVGKEETELRVTGDELSDASPEDLECVLELLKKNRDMLFGEVEVSKKSRPSKSLYAKATDTGVDPEVAAKRLNIDWDSAADIELEEEEDEIEVPPAVGYGALYLVTALPIIIVVSVILILFYNSLQ